MIVRPHKVLLIKNHFIEFSFDEEEDVLPDFDKFKSLNSAEQYYLAENYNWDDGVIVLKWIVESSKCDKGTACMIFWRAEPDYYFDFTADNVDEYERDVWELLQLMLAKFKANSFSRSRFEFIPAKEGYRTDWPTALDIWELPKELKDGVQGKRPFSFGL